jgi:hypothetical protein
MCIIFSNIQKFVKKKLVFVSFSVLVVFNAETFLIQGAAS